MSKSVCWPGPARCTSSIHLALSPLPRSLLSACAHLTDYVISLDHNLSTCRIGKVKVPDNTVQKDHISFPRFHSHGDRHPHRTVPTSLCPILTPKGGGEFRRRTVCAPPGPFSWGLPAVLPSAQTEKGLGPYKKLQVISFARGWGNITQPDLSHAVHYLFHLPETDVSIDSNLRQTRGAVHSGIFEP